MRPFAPFIVLLATVHGVATGQGINPVSDALRDYMRSMRTKFLVVAEALPPAKYAPRPSPSERSFGETVAFTANVAAAYCERIAARSDSSGFADGTDSKDTLVLRLRTKLDFCQDAISKLTDTGLGDTINMNGPKTRAAAMSEATVFWAEQYQQLIDITRRLGHVPPVPCGGRGSQVHGAVECSSGFSQCVSATPGSRPGLAVVLNDAPYSIRSDEGGPYRQDSRNVLTVSVGSTAAFVLADPFVPPRERRAILVDLDHPVAGGTGVRRGVIRDDNNLAILTQWASDSTQRIRNMLEIPIGSTVPAQMLVIEFHIDGIVHVLQFGPTPLGHCFTDGTSVHGRGTSQGSITRPDSTTWIVDLPQGSTGRLFDVSRRYPFAVDLGLYHASLRFTIRDDN